MCGPEGCAKRYGIAYVAASMEYKVFAICFPNPHDPMIIQCAILTVGVDNAWRNFVIEQLSAKAKHLLRNDLLITEGFMHWALNGYGKGILSMNVETETITEILYPASLPDNRYKRRNYYYLSNGRHLSVLICCKDLVWEFWEIRGETLECGKLVKKIDMRAHKNKISETRGKSLVLLGWVKYPSVFGPFLRWYLPLLCLQS